MKKFVKKFFATCKNGISNLLKGDPRVVMLMLTVLSGVGTMFAASDPFASATTEIAGYKDSVQKLLYAIAAVIALVGAFNVFHKMSNGDQDVKKTIMMTLGGCIAMVALSTALPAFFD